MYWLVILFPLRYRKHFFSPLQLDRLWTLAEISMRPRWFRWFRVLSTSTYICQAFVWRPAQECHMIHRKRSCDLAYSYVTHHSFSRVFCILITHFQELPFLLSKLLCNFLSGKIVYISVCKENRKHFILYLICLGRLEELFVWDLP